MEIDLNPQIVKIYDEDGKPRYVFGGYEPTIAENQGGWIYCGDGENLPDAPFGCVVTVIDTEPMTMTDFETILPYHVGYSSGTWNDLDGKAIPFEVVAWMPAPKEPYHEP